MLVELEEHSLNLFDLSLEFDVTQGFTFEIASMSLSC